MCIRDSTSGLLIGLIAGGLVLNLILGRDPNATGIFVLIAEFPGFSRLSSVPWVLPWQIVGGSTVLFTIAAVALTFRQQLTEYGQAKFQARAEMKANGLLQPLGAGMVFGKLGAPSKTAPYVSATFQKFPHCLVVAPTRAGKGVGYVLSLYTHLDVYKRQVQAREEVADREVGAHQNALAEKPPIIATGDWVTTDANVELRPVAVATDRGIHTGYEANLPGGENEVTVSERTFPNPSEALRHAYDFYEGGEEGLALAVKRAAEMDRPMVEEPDRGPEGLVLEHRPQPEFARPETAIYAGNDTQLVLTLGRDNENLSLIHI